MAKSKSDDKHKPPMDWRVGPWDNKEAMLQWSIDKLLEARGRADVRSVNVSENERTALGYLMRTLNALGYDIKPIPTVTQVEWRKTMKEEKS